MSINPTVISPNPKDEFKTDEMCNTLEMCNNNEDKNVSIAQARVKPGIITQLHLLKGIDEKYVIIKGEGKVTVGELEQVEVKVGDVVIIPSDTPQQIENKGSEDLIFYCICTPRFKPESYQSLE